MNMCSGENICKPAMFTSKLPNFLGHPTLSEEMINLFYIVKAKWVARIESHPPPNENIFHLEGPMKKFLDKN